MRDLWEIAGRLIVTGIPQPVFVIAKDGANTTLVNGKRKVVKGVDVMQNALEAAYPGLPCAVFTAGEILRWLSAEDPRAIQFVKTVSPITPPIGASSEFFECIGLLLFDEVFLGNLALTPAVFGAYGARLSQSEKDAIKTYIDANIDAIGSQAKMFRLADWEDGSCHVSYRFYADYVHVP